MSTTRLFQRIGLVMALAALVASVFVRSAHIGLRSIVVWMLEGLGVGLAIGVVGILAVPSKAARRRLLGRGLPWPARFGEIQTDGRDALGPGRPPNDTDEGDRRHD